jgi:6-pyruvoyltetrahydropterin/6-carboxytetrahydropterin synthase
MTNLIYQSGKTYTHAHGLSCCFRQWRADSHCNKLHGYSLQVEVVFEGSLDERNWVIDFGGLKPLKKFLEETFDHKTVVAEDDPELVMFIEMEAHDLVDLTILPAVGCEKFAEYIFQFIQISPDLPVDASAFVKSVTVREHAGNHATVIRT